HQMLDGSRDAGGAQALHRRRHLGSHPASGGHERLDRGGGDQQGPRRADLHRRPLRHRRRSPRDPAGAHRGGPGREGMRSWVVLKFGGTSVSRLERWQTIASLVEARLAEGVRPLIVCSALSGISDRLEQMLALAVRGEHEAALSAIQARHRELGGALGLPGDGWPLLQADFTELSRLALAASLLREAGPKLRARVMAFGEILSTRLGAAYLASRGLPVAWHDARESLTARDEPRASPVRAYLAASCHFDRDEALSARLAEMPGAAAPDPAVITQGFIAKNTAGETVLLGRGGSDTSAALFAARLGAARCEIWTDVPGMFTANPALLPSARLLRVLDYEEAQEIATTG